MPIIDVGTQPSDGENADAADINGQINAILAVVNGHLDGDNFEPGSLPWSVMDDFTNQIPAAAMQDNGNSAKFRDEANIGFVASGLVWSVSSGLDGAMTSGVVYLPTGARIAVSAVSSHTFTASKDTYIDIDTNGAVSYSEVANGNAAPAITTDYVRIAEVITDGSGITAIHSLKRSSLFTLPELARVTLGAAGTTLSVQQLPSCRYLRVVANLLQTGNAIAPALRFNGDSGSNYSYSRGTAGGSDSSTTSNASILAGRNGSAFDQFILMDIVNIAGKPKLVNGHFVSTGTSGAGNAPDRGEVGGKWQNTSDAIARIDLINASNIAASSEMIVYGTN